MDLLLSKITMTTVLIMVTFIVAMAFFRKSNVYYLLLGVILINLLSEILGLTAVLTRKFTVVPFYNLNFLIQPILWFLLIGIIFKSLKKAYFLSIVFLILGMLNLLLIEKSGLNGKTIVLGSFFYISFYIWNHYKYLNEENLNYFKSYDFLILSTPLAFFFGISILLSFGDSGLRSEKLFGKTLYSLIQFISNLIFYSLFIIYLIKSRNVGKQKLELHD